MDTVSAESMSQESLRDNLGYQLHVAARRVDAHDRALLAGLGLTPARFTALIHLRANPGIDQTELGRLLLVNRSAGMKIAGKLGRAGLVERVAGRDRRSVGLALTERGHSVVEAAEERLAASPMLEGSPFATLSRGQRASMLQILAAINAAPFEMPTAGEAAGAKEKPDV